MKLSVTVRAAEVIERARHECAGPLSFSIDGGCCEGTAPHLFENYVITPAATPAAEAEGVPVYLAAGMDEIYKDADVIDGVLEIKCPYSEAVHLRTLTCDRVPDEHRPQLLAGIWIHDVDWGAFGSFDPRRALARRLSLKLMDRDDIYIKRMESRCLEFWEFVQSGQGEVGQIKSDHIQSNWIPKLF